MTNAAFFLNSAFGDALGFELLGGEIVLGGFGVVIIVIVLVIVLPSRVVAFPFVVDRSLVDRRVFECAGGCGDSYLWCTGARLGCAGGRRGKRLGRSLGITLANLFIIIASDRRIIFGGGKGLCLVMVSASRNGWGDILVAIIVADEGILLIGWALLQALKGRRIDRKNLPAGGFSS